MKHNLKDMFTFLCPIAIIALDVLFLRWLYPFLVVRCGYMVVLPVVVIFLLVFGIVASVYLGLMRKLLPLQVGTFEMTHWQFNLWKHYSVIGELARMCLAPFFPIFAQSSLYSILGVKTGKGVVVAGVICVGDVSLVTLADGVVLGHNCLVTGHAVVDGKIVMHPVVVHRGATVGINAVLMPGSIVGEGSVVAPGAVVKIGTQISKNELWGGVPAKKIKDLLNKAGDKT